MQRHIFLEGMLIGHTRRDRESFDAGPKGGSVAADKGWSQAQWLAASGQDLTIEHQEGLVLIHAVAGAMGIERDPRASTELPRGLLKGPLDLAHQLLAHCGRLKAA